jgi:hypothetical protein
LSPSSPSTPWGLAFPCTPSCGAFCSSMASSFTSDAGGDPPHCDLHYAM